MKATRFRIVKRLYGDGTGRFVIQKHHPDYEWVDVESQPRLATLSEAKCYKDLIIKWEQKSLVVSEEVVG